ncbi:MAG: S8 family serine peptidase, partial [Gammaproteobacteria bacterium]|nr:S8 family serine peptidase [Gammaproteobacteria bacterium]
MTTGHKSELGRFSPRSSESFPPEIANSALREAVARVATGRPTGVGLSVSGNRILVDVQHSLDAAAMHASLRAVDAIVYREIGSGLVEAFVPATSVGVLEHMAGVQSVVLPPRAVPLSSPAISPSSAIALAASVVGEEVAKTRADVWHLGGYSGAGVKIGIIDFFDSAVWDPAQSAGEVPAPAGVACWSSGVACDIWTASPGSQHGTAVVEIVHEMAPGAGLYLATAATPGDYETVLDYFAAQGVKIVSHSLTWSYDGPGDGTGPAADVVAYAVSKGMTWISAAGNFAGGRYWHGPWADTNANGWLDFAPGDEVFEFYCGWSTGLRWSDWDAAIPTDYDIYIWDNSADVGNLSLAKASGTSSQTAGSAPLESFELTCVDSSDVDYLAVGLVDAGDGTTGDNLELAFSNGPIEYWSDPYSAAIPFGDAGSSGAVSVGAIDPPTGVIAGSYSSQGPTNDNRIKPDLSAASGVASYTYGTFNGTSASAPATAGAAALIVQAGLAGTPAQVTSYLVDNATVDRGTSGDDNIYGSGELVLPDPPNTAPVAVDDVVSTDEDTLLSGDVLAANPTTPDSDPDGDSLSASLGIDAGHGVVTVGSDGTFTYMPDADWNGSDSFTYTLSDGFLTDTATVSITVTAVDDPPVSRLWGLDRFATAASVASAIFPFPAQRVYLAYGLDFPDALAGGPAAALDGAPLLLTRSDVVPQVTA